MWHLSFTDAEMANAIKMYHWSMEAYNAIKSAQTVEDWRAACAEYDRRYNEWRKLPFALRIAAGEEMKKAGAQ